MASFHVPIMAAKGFSIFTYFQLRPSVLEMVVDRPCSCSCQFDQTQKQRDEVCSGLDMFFLTATMHLESISVCQQSPDLKNYNSLFEISKDIQLDFFIILVYKHVTYPKYLSHVHN